MATTRQLRDPRCSTYKVTFDSDGVVDTVSNAMRRYYPLSAKNAAVKVIVNNAAAILAGTLPERMTKAGWALLS